MSQHAPKSYSYTDCYHVLGLSPDCEWSDIRLAYKKLIQKWHPDRYIDNSAEKIAADDKIKSINIAYHQLSTYYRKNKSLPSADISEKNTAQANPVNSSTKNKEPTPPRPANIKKTIQKRQTSRKNKNGAFKGTIFVTFLTGIYFIASEDFISPPLEPFSEQETYSNEGTNQSLKDVDNNNYTIQTNIRDSLPESTTNAAEEEEHFDIYFSNGSSMGDVVLIQGVPTSTKDNTWYYGKSEVHFYEGKVTHWIRSTENPLKVQLDIR